MKKILISIGDTIKIVLVALAIVIPIRYFLFQPFFVSGQSMEPNFKSGDYLIVDEISYRFKPIQRGEVVVFKFPQDSSQRFIKRVIGLPGETVEIKNNKITISKGEKVEVLSEKYLSSSDQTLGDIKIVLGENEYFVMGDNRRFSYDSRRFGPLPSNKIIGRVFLRLWPINSFKVFLASVSY